VSVAWRVSGTSRSWSQPWSGWQMSYMEIDAPNCSIFFVP